MPLGKKDYNKILSYIMERKNLYFESDCCGKLCNRIRQISDSIDMKFNLAFGGDSTGADSRLQRNRWASKIAIPLMRERFLLRRAMTKSVYAVDPLVSLSPRGNTPYDNAMNLQEVINLNYKHTDFRYNALNPVIDMCSRYGCAVMYSYFDQSQTKTMQTQATEIGIQRVEIVKNNSNVKNKMVHPLNYFQDPRASSAECSQYKGIIERRPLSQFAADVREDIEREKATGIKPSYDIENVKKVIAKAKDSFSKDARYYEMVKRGDIDFLGVDVVRYWGKINCKGYETDNTSYYVEIVGDIIIRFQENPNDLGIVPLSIYTFDPRPEYWWGNVDSENVKPHENYMNLIMSMTADQALKSLERYIFYSKGTIDPQDWNNRHKNGGFVGVATKNNPLNQLLYEYQGADRSLGGTQYLMQEIKESAQRVTSRPDLMRQGLQGGIQNKTATAALLLDQQGNIIEGDYINSFNWGLIQTTRHNATMLQQYLPDVFTLRPDEKAAAMILNKESILGDVTYNVESSLTRNKASEAEKIQNVITALMNYKGTGDPTFQNVDLGKLAREWIKKVDLPFDADTIVPEQQQNFDQVIGEQPEMAGMMPQEQAPQEQIQEAIA